MPDLARKLGGDMPRRKLTNPHAEVEGDDLPELTPRQMAFVRYLLAGKGASDAYRLAYNCENQTPESVWVRRPFQGSHGQTYR